MKVGRPICMADIDFAHDPNQEIYDRFYEACRDLTCADMRRLARALRVHITTVIRWKSGRLFPSEIGTPILVIQWVDKGKPLKMISQADISSSTFSDDRGKSHRAMPQVADTSCVLSTSN